MTNKKFTTVEEYVSSLDAVKANTVKSIIDFITTEFPGLEAKLAWNVPQIHRNGKYVAGIAAYKNHLTFAPWSYRAMEAFQPRLKQYVTFQGCFQIPVDWEIDKELMKDMVNARLTEIDQEGKPSQ